MSRFRTILKCFLYGRQASVNSQQQDYVHPTLQKSGLVHSPGVQDSQLAGSVLPVVFENVPLEHGVG